MSVDVLVVAPLRHELEGGVLTKLDESVSIASKRVLGGTVIGGVGKVASGVAVTRAIALYDPKLVVLVGGYCGALTETLAIADVVCASRVVQYDLDLRAFGLEWGGSTFLGDGSHAPHSFLSIVQQLKG